MIIIVRNYETNIFYKDVDLYIGRKYSMDRIFYIYKKVRANIFEELQRVVK